MALAPGTHIGAYEVVGLLGVGGMGEVYRAHDRRLGRDVAVKVLPEALAQSGERMGRLEREARLLASLSHPHLASIFGFEAAGATRALVMELVPGPTLAELVGRGPLPLEEAVDLGRQIAEGLEYAHERGIVHRDLKPANIKVTPEGAVKLLDFGLAKAVAGEAVEDPSNSPTLSHLATQAGMILGTAAYMAPEQAKGKPVDRRADIWAFGCVLYEMLAGRAAFAGNSIAELLAASLKEDPDWTALPAATPASLRALLRRCLAKAPRQRLQAMGDARIVLEEVQAGAPTATPPPPALPPARRRSWLWAVAAAALGGAGLLAGLWLRPQPPAARVYRFTVMPPAQGVFGDGLAVSPDGSRLAFVASQGNQPQQIWVRTLDSTTARVVEGTDDAEFPFWSPDGASLGFFADGKLKRVDLGTGSVHSLVDSSAGNSRGASWSANGEIVYAPNITGTLMKVSAQGGAPAPATALAADSSNFSQRWPSFLPDGRHFLFLDERAGMVAELEVGALDSTQTQGLMAMPSGSSAAYAAGYLFYASNGALMAQGFDAASRKLSGAPERVADNVNPVGLVGATGYAPFAVTAAGLLVYRQGEASPLSQLTVVDRNGKTVRTIGATGGFIDAQLSPDGKKIVATIPDVARPGVNGIWIMDAQTGAMSRLTFDLRANEWPIWSHDGKWIYYAARTPNHVEMLRQRADGSQPAELLRRSTHVESPTDVSPDGRTFLYTDMAPGTNNDLWTMPATPNGKATVEMQTSADERNAAFSPDGRWVAYQGTVSNSEIYVTTFPASANKWQATTQGGKWPAWGADGRELYFVSGENLMEMPVRLGATPQFGVPQKLFSLSTTLNEDNDAVYSLFPGGGEFLISRTVGGGSDSPITVVLHWQAALGQ